jgi:hypothetical protein
VPLLLLNNSNSNKKHHQNLTLFAPTSNMHAMQPIGSQETSHTH